MTDSFQIALYRRYSGLKYKSGRLKERLKNEQTTNQAPKEEN